MVVRKHVKARRRLPHPWSAGGVGFPAASSALGLQPSLVGWDRRQSRTSMAVRIPEDRAGKRGLNAESTSALTLLPCCRDSVTTACTTESVFLTRCESSESSRPCFFSHRCSASCRSVTSMNDTTRSVRELGIFASTKLRNGDLFHRRALPNFCNAPSTRECSDRASPDWVKWRKKY